MHKARPNNDEVLMSTVTVAYSDRLGEITKHELRLEAEIDATVVRVPLWTRADIESHALDVDALIVGAVEPLDRAALSTLTKCRIISRRGVGLNNIDVGAATDLGIPVAYVPAASVHEVSDHALALIFDLERRISVLDRSVKAGLWTKGGNDLPKARAGMRRLAELSLGVIGYGRIGRELARKAAPSFRTVIVHDPMLEEGPVDDTSRAVELPDLLREADVISLHVPLTPQTSHLFDAAAFAQVKPGLTLVNTSRGGLIDTEALIWALADGRVGHAGLDVSEEEPLPPQSPLLGMDNVLLTGHSASSSIQSAVELRETTVKAVLDALRGAQPEFLANPEVLDQPNCRI
jgi:D-3-phosphoglycerate dehydrogenase